MKLNVFRKKITAYNHMSSNDPKRLSLKKEIKEDFKVLERELMLLDKEMTILDMTIESDIKEEKDKK